MVQTMKHKKDKKKNIQIHTETNEVQNSDTTKIMKSLEMKIKYIVAKETDKHDNYLHPQFKYRNDYDLYSINEDNYDNTSTVQIGKELKEK